MTIWTAAILLAGLASGVCGCQSSAARRRALASQYPLDRARAVVASAEAGDKNAIHDLVGLLEDQDRAVRMYAILALRRLCGETYGYRYYAPEPERAAAVRSWRAALREGRVVLRVAPAAANIDAGGDGDGGETGRAGRIGP